MRIQFVSDLHLEFEQNRQWRVYGGAGQLYCGVGYISHGEFLRNGFKSGRMIEV